MPIYPTMKLPKMISPEEFEKICRDVLAEKYGCECELYGKKGQEQKGIDIRTTLPFKDGKYIVAQCKNYLNVKRKNVFIQNISKDLDRIQKLSFPVNYFVIMTALDRDTAIQDYVASLNSIYTDIDVLVMFWDDIEEWTLKCKKIFKSYYPQFFQDHNGTLCLLESERYSISKNSAKNIAALFYDFLFAEQDSKTAKRLFDVYVENGYRIDDEIYENFPMLLNSLEDEENLLIEGDPGLGKSSLIMNISDQYIAGDIFENEIVFFIRGKDIRNSNGDPIEDIVKYLKLSEKQDLEDAIVFIDGYDEIAFVSKSIEHNRAYYSQLELNFTGKKLIITSRPDYIRNFAGSVAKLQSFSREKRKLFIEKYNQDKPEKDRIDGESIEALIKEDNEYDNGLEEIIAIPMLLYLIVVNKIDIDEISDRFSLYEKVFGNRNTDGAIKRNRKVSQIMWDELYKLATNIAHFMYMKSELYIDNDEVIRLIECMHLSQEDTEILKNRFGIEIYLKGTTGKSFTFIHTSIYEFFTAKYICNRVLETLQRYLSDEEFSTKHVIKDFNTIFNARNFAPNIFLYVMENIQCGCFDILFKESDQKLYILLELLNKLLDSQVCVVDIDDVPYFVLLKNMLLWIFNIFSVYFGRLDIDGEAHWVEVNPDVVTFLINNLDTNDYLFLAHMKLHDVLLQKTDFKNCHFIDNDFSGSNFSYSYCNDISVSGQHFDNMKMKSIDLYGIALDNCSFEKTDLRFSDMRNAIFEKVSFKGADLRAVSVEESCFFSCDFEGAHISSDTFGDVTTLEETTLENAIVHDMEEGADEDILFKEDMN